MNLARPDLVNAPVNAGHGGLPAAALQPGDSMAAALAAGERLAELLEAEFAALKVQDMDAMEQLQNGKTEQLQALAAWAAKETEAGALPASWSVFQDLIAQCRQAHWRNETLMSRQLDAIRGTLRALNAGESDSVDLYDRMGQVGRRRGARGYNDV